MATYARNLPFKNSIWQTHVQEATPVKNKIKILLECITALEERFNSKPSDVVELRRRDDVIRYAIVALLR